MNTGNLRGISLSSLAVSVSTGGLLGVTGVALGDDPYEPVCHVGESCEVSAFDAVTICVNHPTAARSAVWPSHSHVITSAPAPAAYSPGRS